MKGPVDIVAPVVAVVVIGIVAQLISSINDNYTMSEMVKAGAHPIDAMCALKPYNTKYLCIARATSKENK